MVLTMVYNAMNHWVSGLSPLSGILKSTKQQTAGVSLISLEDTRRFSFQNVVFSSF
jgi:hypothetical protein